MNEVIETLLVAAGGSAWRGRAFAQVIPAGFALVLLGACAASDAPPSGDPGSFSRFLEREVPLLMERASVPGAAVALLDEGEVIWVRGFGSADATTGDPVSERTVFQAASISKSISAWGVMRLVEQGALDLDAPVERYLTRWHLPASRFDSDGVTVRRLLSHTAGLSLPGYPGLDPDTALPTIEESLSGDTGGAGDVRIVQEPGTGFRYSGGGYTLLQLVIEEVSGEPFAEYMRREVLEPLGMLSSSFEWSVRLRPAMATGHDISGRPLPNYLFAEQAPAGLYTTAPDLARFAAAAGRGPSGEPPGRGVLEPETIALMTEPSPGTAGLYGLGYGLHFFGGALSDMPVAGHGGSNRGWKTQFVVVPSAGEGLVVLTNGDGGGDVSDDALCWWGAWWAGSSLESVCPRPGRAFALGAAGVLGIGLVGYCGWVVRGATRGRRRASRTLSPKRIARVALPLLGIIAWWVLSFAVLDPYALPETFSWLMVVVTLWGLALVASAFVPNVHGAASRQL